MIKKVKTCIMCDFEVCRICLRNDAKFYSVDKFELKYIYKQVTNLPISDKDGFPQHLCYECAALLYKFHRFKEKCTIGYSVLLNLLINGPITYESICELNISKAHRCQKPYLRILSLNKHVKMYHIQHKEDNSDKIKEENPLDIDCSDNIFSDDEDFECNDPENDPVADENSVENVDMTVKIDIKDHNTETKLPIVVKVEPAVEFDIKPPLEQTILGSLLKEENEKEVKSEVIVEKSLEGKETNKINIKHIENNNDSLNKALIVIRAKKVSKTKTKKKEVKPKNVSKPKAKRKAIPPESAEGYKFNKPKSLYWNSAFLESGFWKKSNFTEEEALKNFEAKAQDKKYLKAAYKCTDCYRGFSKLSMLERHIPQRHGEAAGDVICQFCKIRFNCKYELRRHVRQHYTKYECLRCDLVCSFEMSALYHEEYHNGVNRKCPHCDRVFKHMSTFYTHLRTHKSKHTCAYCGESFVSELGLRLHKKAKHLAVTEPPLKFLEENSYCEICQMKFETKDAYDKHLQHSALHTDPEFTLGMFDGVKNPFVEDRDETENAIETKAEELYKRRTKVEKALSAERKVSTHKGRGRKPTTCHQCGKHFKTQSACVKHHRTEHPGTSFFPAGDRVICEICGASLAPDSVPAHLNKHTRAKMYTCDTCGRSFTTSTMLRTHLVTHTGEKRFGCSLCEKRFTQSASLKLHHRTFHLKEPYPKRNRKKKIDNMDGGIGDDKIK